MARQIHQDIDAVLMDQVCDSVRRHTRHIAPDIGQIAKLLCNVVRGIAVGVANHLECGPVPLFEQWQQE